MAFYKKTSKAQGDFVVTTLYPIQSQYVIENLKINIMLLI